MQEVRLIAAPLVHTDERGTLVEAWRSARGLGFGKAVAGLTSYNKANVLRGLHYQYPNPRGLIVRCVQGMIWDVVVDLRKGSPAYGRAQFQRLSEYVAGCIPAGYAHGFYTVTESIVIYECDEQYSEADAKTLSFRDVDWRGIIPEGTTPIMSEKDLAGTRLADTQPLEV